jgi:competence protein ComGC
MVDSQVEAYALKHNKKPHSIDELISEGYIKENQKYCKSGATIHY